MLPFDVLFSGQHIFHQFRHAVALEDPTPTVTTQGFSTTFSCKFSLLRCVILGFTTYLQCECIM